MGKQSEDGAEKKNDRQGGPAIVEVNPKPRSGLASTAIDLAEKLAVKLAHDSPQPLHYLAGLFAPVLDETPPAADLPVKGNLPDCLNGEFVRVGPNPKFPPIAGYHWFDGDGMIHGLRIKDGKATYVCRYVKTSHLKQEEFYGGAKFLKLGDLKGYFGLFAYGLRMLREKLKVLDMSYGLGTANTALVYHHGRLLALQEADKPYVVQVMEDGDLQTLGLLDYDKRLGHAFTAHPKVDPFTGEMFAFGYATEPPYITYRVISKDGFMHDPVPITIPEPIMMHDFAITENYAIFMDLPLCFRPKRLLTERGFILHFDAMKSSRFGILPRYAKDELLIRWHEMRFNMKSGLASQRKLAASAVDFPRINESYTGRKQRYVYGAINSFAKITGIIKFDLYAKPEQGKTNLEVGGNVQGIFELGPGRYGSEAVFVPRVPGVTSEEDDGYLICFMHDELTGTNFNNRLTCDDRLPPSSTIDEDVEDVHNGNGSHATEWTKPYGCNANMMTLLSSTKTPSLDLRNQSPERPNHRWEQGFRVEIPQFDGNMKPEEVINWLSQVEEILDFKEVPDDRRVSLVTIRLHGRGQAWWQQLKLTRTRQGKAKITCWSKFRKHLRAAFLPYNFDRELYQRFQNLRQGTHKVDEYSTEFYSFLAWVDTNESPLQLVSRYIGGLRLQLQDVLNMFDPCERRGSTTTGNTGRETISPTWR
ncbi:unnamed protein product [Linum tenue]|uniref:carotenoid 9,10-dioxygenase n=1 Tax=Linum tenue TaxID=586396 RepID=A0AAV0J6Y5_9ROSI|nr:unnamed protein product [Linum tenue]